jgi:hypothetical protein
MEYTVIEEDVLSTLIAKVNEYVRNGWQPQGGISMATDWRNYAQAMIRG